MGYNKNGLLLCKSPRAYYDFLPKAKIYKDKSMRLNSAVLRIYDSENHKYVRFFFDKENHVLALELSNTFLEGSIKKIRRANAIWRAFLPIFVWMVKILLANTL